MYDLQIDPREQFDLIDVPAFRQEVSRMRQRLLARLVETGGMEIPPKPAGPWQAAERELP